MAWLQYRFFQYMVYNKYIYIIVLTKLLAALLYFYVGQTKEKLIGDFTENCLDYIQWETATASTKATNSSLTIHFN